jgi:hypothetical protein
MTSFLDSILRGPVVNSGAVTWLSDAVAATTGNVTLADVQTIDGYAGSAGQIVLVWQQTSAAENGLYVMGAGAWSRVPNTTRIGAGVLVLNGAANGGRSFRLIGSGPWTPGTTPQLWGVFESVAVASEPVGTKPHVFEGKVCEIYISSSGSVVGRLALDSADVDFGTVPAGTRIPGLWKQITSGTATVIGMVYG